MGFLLLARIPLIESTKPYEKANKSTKPYEKAIEKPSKSPGSYDKTIQIHKKYDKAIEKSSKSHYRPRSSATFIIIAHSIRLRNSSHPDS